MKTNAACDEQDPEEYSQYFPSFLWVVRDFALQLVDQDGEQISPKDYLERAMATQKGFSEQVEAKNRIRRLLKTFFNERDCCTMIRPLTNEEDLQNLEKKDLNELRPEFAEQVMTLRRKVLNRVKPKLLNGKELNGRMLAGLVTSYVGSINTGVVPNIESAWSYICKNECQKAQDKAVKQFEEDLQESFDLKAPMFEDELKELYKDAKRYALETFKSASIGEDSEEFMEDLKMKFKLKYDHLRVENDRAASQKAQAFMQNYFAPIEQKLRNSEYECYGDFESDLQEFQICFMEEGPPGPHKREIMLDFCINSLGEACQFFIRTADNELKMQTSMSEQTIKKLEEKVTELKEELSESKNSLETKLRQSETEKAHLFAKEQTLQETLNNVKADKDKADADFKERISSEKKQAQMAIDEYKMNSQNAEETAKALQRQVMSSEMEFDK